MLPPSVFMHDATGPSDELWEVVSNAASDSDFSIVGSEAAEWDVRSVGSSTLSRPQSMHSTGGRSVSSTAAYGDFSADHGTASTVGLPIPLASLPLGVLLTGVQHENEDNRSDIRSVNTRRGWPRVSLNANPPPEPATRRASYRDMLLAAPSPHTPAAGDAPTSGSHQDSGSPAPVPRYTVPHRADEVRTQVMNGRVVLAPVDRYRARRRGDRRPPALSHAGVRGLDTLAEEAEAEAAEESFEF